MVPRIRGSSITAMAAEGRLSKMKGLRSPLRLAVSYCNEDTNRLLVKNKQKKYIHVHVCLHYPEEDGGELDEQGFIGVGRAYEVQGVFSTLSAMVTRARRREAGRMPLDWMGSSSQSEP